MVELIVFGGVTFFITVNVFLYLYIVNKAVKKLINPYMTNLGYEIRKVRFSGLFSTGDFKRGGFDFRSVMAAGQPINSIFAYVYIENVKTGVTRRITAKITTLFWFIKKVEYSVALQPVE